jgi:hypothetical protein
VFAKQLSIEISTAMALPMLDANIKPFFTLHVQDGDELYGVNL